MLNKKKLTIAAITILLTLAIIFIISNQKMDALGLELSSNQKLVDYAFNEQWLFAIIEEKHVIDQQEHIFIYKSSSSSDNIKWKRVTEYDFSVVSPWKVKLGNIDYTDGLQVIMGVNKTTHFDKEKNNRLFVFNWDGEKLYKKWTGTRLGYYLKDFYIMDILDIKGDELVVIDQNKDGMERLLVYYWLDFGFHLLAESKFFDSIDEVNHLDNNLLELVCEENGKNASIKVIVSEGKIIEID